MKSVIFLLFISLLCVSQLLLVDAEKEANEKTWKLETRPGFGIEAGEPDDVSLTDAYNYLMYCWAAYCTSSVPNWSCQYCSANQVVSAFQPKTLVNGDDDTLFAYTGVNAVTQQVFQVFRGTVVSSLENWLADLNTFHTYWDGSDYLEVHEGFYESYLYLADGINEGLFELIKEYPNYQVVVLGHSLGGAMATLSAINLTVNYGITPLVYTFGSPRVGNPDFADFYAQNIPVNYRFTNDDDIVPHVPPSAFDFQHVVQEIWFNGTVWFECSPTNGEDPYCADSVSVIDYSISDHLDYFGVQLTC